MGSLLLTIVNYYLDSDGVTKIYDGNWYFENKAEGLIYAGLGILIVFAGMLILIGILMLVGFIFKKLEKSGFLDRKNAKNKKQAEKAAEASSVQQSVTDMEASSDEIPDEVKVAIMAAIMAYYQTEQPKCEFTVKRIKRI